MTSYITHYVITNHNTQYKSKSELYLSRLSPEKLKRLEKLAEKLEEEEEAEIRRKSYDIYYCV